MMEISSLYRTLNATWSCEERVLFWDRSFWDGRGCSTHFWILALLEGCTRFIYCTSYWVRKNFWRRVNPNYIVNNTDTTMVRKCKCYLMYKLTCGVVGRKFEQLCTAVHRSIISCWFDFIWYIWYLAKFVLLWIQTCYVTLRAYF